MEAALPAQDIVELRGIGLATNLNEQAAPVGSELGSGERMGMLHQIPCQNQCPPQLLQADARLCHDPGNHTQLHQVEETSPS